MQKHRPLLPRILERPAQLFLVGHDSEAALSIGMGKRVSTRGSADRPLRPAAGSQFQQRLGRLGCRPPRLARRTASGSSFDRCHWEEQGVRDVRRRGRPESATRPRRCPAPRPPRRTRTAGAPSARAGARRDRTGAVRSGAGARPQRRPPWRRPTRPTGIGRLHQR